MELNRTSTNNTLSTQYKTQTNSKTGTAVTETSKENAAVEKAMQEMLFSTMLTKMMGSKGDSMMSEILLTALSNNGSSSLSNSLSAMSDFSSNIRQSSMSLSGGYDGTSNGFNGLGLRASKYESNLDPGAISNTPGDYGGKSYGAWQFSANTGSLSSFINSLKDKDSNLYNKFMNAKIIDGNTYGANFDNVWTQEARGNRNEFLGLQQQYIKENFYDKAAATLKSKYGFDISEKSNALKESLWSTAVQHGPGGAASIFSKLNLNGSDANIINDLYTERQKVNIYFRSSSSQIRQSVYNRFTRERQDMLSMLNGQSV
ncbi:hypothetical protein SAMN02745163_02890 [Clostridium cavendishii DSM 21758]|uniref:Type VI secretion system spike protein VgrG3-like C-terminal domain-containing protein n=1 Tax=Clostridium cavendishii DSM 21758 TaxID=1121302 RepID=A0A1M6NF25_9CLOT|nr:vgrg protein [Clostridium cavendishii]SHJ94368.1 hypothetical protein SAMN02745163_02890 [Clostridium cavendishii DSM 21758]